MPVPPQNTSLLPKDSGVSVQSFGSGSSGNAFLVTAGSETLLIDCGVGIRALTLGLRNRGLALSDLGTICVTHEHSDHIKTLPRVAHDNSTMYATLGTAQRSGIHREQHVSVKGHASIRIGAITIWPLPVSHDASEPCGYMLELPDGARVTMLTDIGSWHESLAEYVAASDLIILEANHDVDMLRLGPYPFHLKRRVASDVGHLSNLQCGIALAETLRTTTHQPTIWLAHLSEHNNLPFLAEDMVRTQLAKADQDLDVMALPRRNASPIWIPTPRAAKTASFTPTTASPVQLGFDW